MISADPATDLGRSSPRSRPRRVAVSDAPATEPDRSRRGAAYTDLPGWFLEPTVLAGERIDGRIGEELPGRS
jgi:hypothetical protein